MSCSAFTDRPARPDTTTAEKLTISHALQGRAWLVVIVIGVTVASFTNFVLSDDQAALDWLYLGGLAAAFAAMVVGIRLQSAPREVVRGWSLIAAGMFCYLAGESLWAWTHEPVETRFRRSPTSSS